MIGCEPGPQVGRKRMKEHSFTYASKCISRFRGEWACSHWHHKRKVICVVWRRNPTHKINLKDLLIEGQAQARVCSNIVLDCCIHGLSASWHRLLSWGMLSLYRCGQRTECLSWKRKSNRLVQRMILMLLITMHSWCQIQYMWMARSQKNGWRKMKTSKRYQTLFDLVCPNVELVDSAIKLVWQKHSS